MNRTGTKLYAADVRDGVIHVLNSSGLQELEKIDVALQGISSMVLAHRNGRNILFVTEMLQNSLALIDADTGELMSRVKVGSKPSAVAVDAGNAIAYVANFGDNSISVVDFDKSQLVENIAVGRYPVGVALSHDMSRLYVVNSGTKSDNRPRRGSVSVIDTVESKLISELVVGLNPAGLELTPDGAKLYVTNAGSGYISVLGMQENALHLLKKLRVGSGVTANGKFIAPGDTFHHVHVHESGDKLLRAEFIRAHDGHSQLSIHPYGKLRLGGSTSYTTTRNDFEKRLKKWLEKEEVKLKSVEYPVTGFGWNPSVGPASDGCFSGTATMNISDINEQASLTGSASSSDIVSQKNFSTSIGFAAAAIKASNSYTNSSVSKSSRFSGSAVSNAFILGRANFTLDSSSPLTSYGYQQCGASTAGSPGTCSTDPDQLLQFTTSCGSQYIESVVAGVMITATTTWSTNSESTTNQLNDTFSAGYSGASLSTTYSSLNSTASNVFSVDYSYNIQGGGLAVARAFLTPWTQFLQDATLCQSDPSVANCNKQVSDMASAAASALSAFTDWSTADIFPYGAPTTPSNTMNSPATISRFPANIGLPSEYSTLSDPFSGYVGKLETVLNLVNQLNTLSDRSSYLYSSVHGTVYDTPNIPLTSSLNASQVQYSSDAAAMANAVFKCLYPNPSGSISFTSYLDQYCGTGLSNYITSKNPGTALAWYSLGFTQGKYANDSAVLNNVLALQFAATSVNGNTCNQPYVNDVAFIPSVPGKTNGSSWSMPALVAFSNSPWVSSGNCSNSPTAQRSYSIWALRPSASLTWPSNLTDPVISYLPLFSNNADTVTWLGIDGGGWISTPDGSTGTQAYFASTFDNSCIDETNGTVSSCGDNQIEFISNPKSIYGQKRWHWSYFSPIGGQFFGPPIAVQ